MFEVIGGIVSILSAVVAYWIYKKTKSTPQADLLARVAKEKARREAQASGGLDSVAADDYARLRDLDVLLSKKDHNDPQ